MSQRNRPKLPIFNIDEFEHNANWLRHRVQQRRERITAETHVEDDGNHADNGQPRDPTDEAQSTTPPPN